jgi:hypothetical protein
MNLFKLSACLVVLPLAACSHQNASEGVQNAPSAFAPSETSAAPNADLESGPTAMNESAPAPATATAQPSSAPRASAGLDGAAAGSARAGRAYEPEKKAEDRPGLGTTWGETRTSYVSNERFDRATPSSPFAVVSLNYNDEAGIQAMARRMGNAYESFDR